MKILLITHCNISVSEVSVGGIETIAFNMACQLIERNHEVILVCKDFISEKYRPVIFRSPSNELDKNLDLLKRLHNDAIFCDLTGNLNPSDFRSIKFCTVYHIHPKYTKFFKHGNFAFVSEYLRKKYSEYHNHSITEADIILNGIPSFNLSSNNLENKAVTFFGRINKLKGIEIAAAACDKIGVTLRVFGGYGTNKKSDIIYNDIQYLKYLETKFSSIKYLGTIDSFEQKKELYRTSSTIIIPSIEPETCSLVALEAADMGVPIIAFKKGGIVEYLEDYCIWVDYGNSRQSAIENLYTSIRIHLENFKTFKQKPLRKHKASIMTKNYINWWNKIF